MSDSFLSIVEHSDDDRLLLVRARFEGDIEKVFPEADVAETPSSDYRYRASVPRERVAEAIAGQVRHINYPNFKDSVSDVRRRQAYIKVWEQMWRAQNDSSSK